MGSDNENNWRKAEFIRDLSDVEKVLIGDGAGTEWSFEHPDGKMDVKFKADGYNHFQCDDYPAHAHWKLDGAKVFIDWANYGKYELVIDPEKKSMEGGALGADWKEHWRKATLVRNLINNATVEECSYKH